MFGDMILIYNTATGKFFAGRERRTKIYEADEPPYRYYWVKSVERAKRSSDLNAMHRICADIGPEARIVSETSADRIVRLREYREAHGNGIRQ